MKAVLGYKYEVSIETFTPVSIGSGDTLSPLSDFWVYGDKAYLLDQDKFQRALEEKPEYAEVYIQELKGLKEKKNTYLYDFIRYKLQKDPDTFISKEINIMGEGNAIELKACLTEAGKLLIPGSTVKGAIKSALLYNWLMKEERRDEIITILNTLEFLYDSKEDLFKKEKRLRAEITKHIEQFIERMDKKNKMNFSLLRVGDAYFDKASSIYVHTARYPLRYNKKNQKDNEKPKIPVFVESIDHKELSAFSVFFEENKVAFNLNPYITDYFGRDGLVNLFADINKYSNENIRYEKRCVKRISELDEYLKKLNELQDLIKNAGKNEAYIPLGFGKTNFYQSIGLALFNWIKLFQAEDEDDSLLTFSFESYLKLFTIGIKGQQELPLTRTLIKGSQHPLGWVKLTINE